MFYKKEGESKNNNNDLFHKKKSLNRMEYKKGPFSRSETLLVESALKFVLKEEGIFFKIENGKKTFSLERKRLPKNFWGKVALHIPSRSVESIYDHARRRLSTKNYKGKWSSDDLLMLNELVKIYGRCWTKIGNILNRLPGACYDKWRDALKNGDKRKKGRWNQEERCKLIQLITFQTNHETIQEHGVEKKTKWTLLADKIGTRSYLQCRNEWSRFFSPGSKLKLTFADSLNLLKSISSPQITDESEIKWDNILIGIPSHKTYNKWRSLCKKFIRKNFNENGIPLSFNKAVQIITEKLSLSIFKSF